MTNKKNKATVGSVDLLDDLNELELAAEDIVHLTSILNDFFSRDGKIDRVARLKDYEALSDTVLEKSKELYKMITDTYNKYDK